MSALRQHWPEYLMEALALGLFMVSACVFGVVLEHPASPVREAIPDETARRVLMGMAMGLTSIANIYSPWGKRSGAHMNPAVTLTFLALRKVKPLDALFYVLAQFAGGLAGVLLATTLLGAAVAHPSVSFVATVPGPRGALVAFAAEIAIAFLLMSVVLRLVSRPETERFAGIAAGCLVALWIAVEAPLSGMSMNPARTAASAIPSGIARSLWIYFLAPPLGMALAAWLFRAADGARARHCAKLRHPEDVGCIFCGHEAPSGLPAR